MDAFDFNSHDAFLDFSGGTLGTNDPRGPPYSHFLHSQNPSWPSSLALDTLDGDAASHLHPHPPQHHLHSHHQQQQTPQPQQHAGYTASNSHHPQPSSHSRPTSRQNSQSVTLHTAALGREHGNMLPNNWQLQMQHAAAQQQQRQQQQQQQQQQHSQPPPPQQQPPQPSTQSQPNPSQQAQYGMPDSHALSLNTFGPQLQASPVDFMPASNAESYTVPAGMAPANFITMAGPMDSMNALVYPLTDYQNDMTFSMSIDTGLEPRTAESVHSSMSGNSPTGTSLEVQSLSDNEGSWSMVNFSNPHRHSFDSYASTISNPSQALHIRTNSDSSSDGPNVTELSGSYEEISPWTLNSPHDLHGQDYLDAQFLQHQQQQQQQQQRQQQQQQQQQQPPQPQHQHPHGIPIPNPAYTSPPSSAVSPATGIATTYRSSGSSSTSPTSSGPTSPPLRRRKSPLDKTTKPVIKKTSPVRKETLTEKKVGRRRGPLRPDQRQQAHEIRKLRACLRCKFLKKTCDKGEPCGGCRPSHARLWQVPCTRMDIKDIAYFMKDWKADYERHVSLGFSVGNIKGFSTLERTLYVTHGYGHYLPISAREVFVRDDKCFGVDWTETTFSENPEEFEYNTAKLSAGMEGISTTLLSEYLDRHLDQGFETFVDNYFEGTKFLTEILKTAYRYYLKEKTPAIRKALKLVLAYNLTLHITMVEGLSDEESFIGKIDDNKSKWFGKTLAPVMINFQIKCALADMWRELQKDILEELSALYSSVYSGDKLKNWPTIFMLAALLLAIWEEMQFDCHYRVPDEKAVHRFCEEMETTPVGVIVGLFQAISTKLPGLQEWDTRKHHHLLGSNPAICDALTEVKGHVNKYEKYLKERQTAKFNREDFDCLSNKFLSKLVIRAN